MSTKQRDANIPHDCRCEVCGSEMRESDELIQLRTMAMLAQAAVDAFDKGRNTVELEESIGDLRFALTRIGKPADSAGAKKTSANRSPEAGEDETSSPS